MEESKWVCTLAWVGVGWVWWKVRVQAEVPKDYWPWRPLQNPAKGLNTLGGVRIFNSLPDIKKFTGTKESIKNMLDRYLSNIPYQPQYQKYEESPVGEEDLLPAIPVDQILNNGVCWRKKAMINGTRLFTFQPLCLSDLLWLKGEPIDIQITTKEILLQNNVI